MSLLLTPLLFTKTTLPSSIGSDIEVATSKEMSSQTDFFAEQAAVYKSCVPAPTILRVADKLHV